jgi:TAG lipase/lysophosphatidylethanolamine acyltransferase
LTFEEAYLKTDRVLNITVTPKYLGGTTNNIPNLLNYLTAPHMVIWSAARASIGTGVIHKNVELLVKNHKGEIERYHNSRVDFSPANRTVYISTRDSPYTRLSELFNVNSFIVSLARPYFAPILLSDFKHRGYQGWRIRLLKLLRLEVQHRLEQMTKLGLLPGIVQQLFVDENIPNAFQVTVVPELTSLFRDLGKIFDSDNIKDKVDYWIFVGERSVWPMLTIIWARCAIEFVLDDIYNKKRELYTATN